LRVEPEGVDARSSERERDARNPLAEGLAHQAIEDVVEGFFGCAQHAP
jgi:hypothetical protein